MKAEDIDLATDIRTTVLAQSPRGGRAIIWTVMALFVLAIIWAYFSEIEQTTRGAGKVIPSSQIQVVQNLEGGIISEILVDVGSLVKKGHAVGCPGAAFHRALDFDLSRNRNFCDRFRAQPSRRRPAGYSRSAYNPAVMIMDGRKAFEGLSKKP